MAFITGPDRREVMLLPPVVDDYVPPDAAVRVVDAFVASLDMAALGFSRAQPAREGRPGYDPRDLLKLYIYGTLNGVRSSRRLERECQRNVELLWLLRRLAPDFKTIADFRRDNGPAIVACCRRFVLFCRAQDLFGGAIATIDGSKVRAAASRKRIISRADIEAEVVRLDEAITAHLAAMDDADAREPDEAGGPAVDAALAALREERTRAARQAAQMRAQGQTYHVEGEAEARPMRQAGGARPPAYNVQIAVDPDSHMVVHHAVTTDANDSRQLLPMARAARDALGAATLTAVADTGYANATQAAQCEAEGITPVAPPPAQVNRHGAYFPPTAFAYDAARDTMTCPAGRLLLRRGLCKAGTAIRYRAESCAGCALKARCTKAERRHVHRLVHQPALDRMAARIAADPALIRLRRCTAEHPFACIKRMLGGRFLMRGTVKAATETALAVLAYNIRRATALLGQPALIGRLT